MASIEIALDWDIAVRSYGTYARYPLNALRQSWLFSYFEKLFYDAKLIFLIFL